MSEPARPFDDLAGEPGRPHGSAGATSQTGGDLRDPSVARVYAQPIRHICGACGETREGSFGETLAWYREHAKACRRRIA